MVGIDRDLDFENAVDRAFSDQPEFDDQPWYTTMALERTVELDFERVEDAKPEQLERVENDVRRDAENAFEMIIASVVLPLAIWPLTRTRDRIYLTVEGRERVLFMPRFDMQASGVVIRAMENFPLQVLKDRLSDLEQHGRTWRTRLATAAYWYAAMLETDDDWKRFYWGFVGLEVLVSKLAAHVRQDALGALRMTGEERESVPQAVLAELVWEQQRMPLASRFALVASYLSPGTAEQDTSEFRRAQDVRDKLSHGERVGANRLPTDAVRDLLQRYYELALQLT
jgi:hypothetical protein